MSTATIDAPTPTATTPSRTVLPRATTTWENGRLVNRQACSYCWATFTQRRVDQEACSKVCATRNSAWRSWINSTRRAAILGSPGTPVTAGPALPPGGASLAAAVAVHQLDLSTGVAV